MVSFQNNSNPGQDLVRTPPGLLALDTMYYFARRYPDAYSRVSSLLLCWAKTQKKQLRVSGPSFFSQFVLENSSREDKHECPFARSSIQLTLILCEILRIGEAREWELSPSPLTPSNGASCETFLPSAHSLGDGVRLPPHLLQPGPAAGGAVLCLHSAPQQDLEGNESHAGGL